MREMENGQLFNRKASGRKYAVATVLTFGLIAAVIALFHVLAVRAVAVGASDVADVIGNLRRVETISTLSLYVLLVVLGLSIFYPLFRSTLDQHERLFDLARTDPLTGSYNRRSFEEVLTREVVRFRRTGRAPSLLMLDIDHFKSINDQFGHQAGDAAIVHFVSTTLGIVRTSDIFGRLGGEEFAVLLPETDQEGATAAAEKIRSAVENTPLKSDGKSIPMTVSIGVAVALPEMQVTDLVATADRALYAAKTAGRNRYRV